MSYGHFILNYESGNERNESENPKNGNARARFRVPFLESASGNGFKGSCVRGPRVFFGYGISARYLGNPLRSFAIRLRYYRLTVRIGNRDNLSKQVFSCRNGGSFFTSERNGKGF